VHSTGINQCYFRYAKMNHPHPDDNNDDNIHLKPNPPLAAFELPNEISEDDQILLSSILSVLCSLEICTAYKVQPIVSKAQGPTAFGSYLIRGSLDEDVFEVSMEEMHHIFSANRLRIEHIAVARCEGKNELLIKVLNSKQRVMLTNLHSSTFIVCNKKRKFEVFLGSSE